MSEFTKSKHQRNEYMCPKCGGDLYNCEYRGKVLYTFCPICGKIEYERAIKAGGEKMRKQFLMTENNGIINIDHIISIFVEETSDDAYMIKAETDKPNSWRKTIKQCSSKEEADKTMDFIMRTLAEGNSPVMKRWGNGNLHSEGE